MTSDSGRKEPPGPRPAERPVGRTTKKGMEMQHPRKKAVAALALSAFLLAGCAAGGDQGSDAAAADCAPADGPVTLEFTSWIPGIDKVVDLWNKDRLTPSFASFMRFTVGLRGSTILGFSDLGKAKEILFWEIK